jgi:hypothetical protein
VRRVSDCLFHPSSLPSSLLFSLPLSLPPSLPSSAQNPAGAEGGERHAFTRLPDRGEEAGARGCKKGAGRGHEERPGEWIREGGRVEGKEGRREGGQIWREENGAFPLLAHALPFLPPFLPSSCARPSPMASTSRLLFSLAKMTSVRAAPAEVNPRSYSPPLPPLPPSLLLPSFAFPFCPFGP